jgi:nucleotide-binding universal stress UspA family protein
MTDPTILVVLTAPESVAACLRAAADAAAALPSPRIEVLDIRLDAAGLVQPPEILTRHYEQAVDARSAAQSTARRAAFDAWRAGGPAAEAVWIDVKAVPAVAVRERGALAALLVVARPVGDIHPADAAGFDAALFETGKPVLVVPPGPGAPFGRHLAVGWRDVAATRHSLEALRPWLMAAETVSLIAVTDGETALPSEWEVANLPLGATLHVIRPAGRTDGAALLQEVEALGADGLAMGAYRRGRLVERLLGGVTAEALQAARTPLLMRV